MEVKFAVGAVYGNTLPCGGEGISIIQGFPVSSGQILPV